jgi:integrase
LAETTQRAATRNAKKFTPTSVFTLKRPKAGHLQHWDNQDKGGQRGLSVLVSDKGTRTYRSTFNLGTVWISRKLGRVGELTLDEARTLTQQDRRIATFGIDPRGLSAEERQDALDGITPEESRRRAEAKRKTEVTYETVVGRFIAEYAKPRQRTWNQTQYILKRTCAPLLKMQMGAITKGDLRSLLRGFVSDGRSYKAMRARAWLQKLWRWAFEEDLVASPLVDGVRIEFERRTRDLIYSDEDIRAIWHAADRLSAEEGAYIKLLILLAPRKTALALLRWQDLDDPEHPTSWTTPFELTKSKKTASRKRVYLTPLPPLAQRIIRGLAKTGERVFPSLRIYTTVAGRPEFDTQSFRRRLTAAGGPEGFTFHVARHTLATWLENEGASEYERALILNHAGSGSVTSGYSHGYPHQLKLGLLTRWSDHVERLVQPEGVTLLR